MLIYGFIIEIFHIEIHIAKRRIFFYRIFFNFVKESVFLTISGQDYLRDLMSSVRIIQLQKYRTTAVRSITCIVIAHRKIDEVSFEIGKGQNIKLIVRERCSFAKRYFSLPDQIDSRALAREKAISSDSKITQ